MTMMTVTIVSKMKLVKIEVRTCTEFYFLKIRDSRVFIHIIYLFYRSLCYQKYRAHKFKYIFYAN